MTHNQLNFEEIRKNHLKEISEIKKNRNPIILVTDGVNDVGNIAMLFRLADALRIKKIILYNLKENFNFKLLKKKSRHTSEYVPYEIITDISEIEKLKTTNYLVAVEKTDHSLNYTELIPKTAVCFIIGSEKFGISQEMLSLVDTSVHLPSNGINTSINVATAAGVVLYDYNSKINQNK